jgi:hypothetical protein
MRKLSVLVFLLLISLGIAFGGSKKTVHVKEYTRRDGTVVQAHERSAPGTRSSASAAPHARKSAGGVAKSAASAYEPRDSHGRIKRSSSAKTEFERTQPCPATGRVGGPCSGYVIDHKTALACGGADSPENMQWQTAAEAKLKDKTERAGCR